MRRHVVSIFSLFRIFKEQYLKRDSKVSFEIFIDNVFHIIIEDGVPKGIRTPVTAVKGQCPGPLDDGDTNDPLQDIAFCSFTSIRQSV